METDNRIFAREKGGPGCQVILEVGLIENLSLERMMFLELLASLLYKTHSVWKLAIVMLGALYRFGFITSRTCVRTFEIFTEM